MTIPLCFVLMPFGVKSDPTLGDIDYNAVYAQVIRPAIEQAGMEPLRADEEQGGGFIHKAMFERLLLCDYAVADLTAANANVYYELGIRHATRPFSTVLIHAQGFRLPFDIAPVRSLPYQLTREGAPAAATRDGEALTSRLLACRNHSGIDSPVYQLVPDLPPPEIKRLKTDTFRQQTAYHEGLKKELALARKQGLDALRAVEKKLGNLPDAEAGVVTDLFLSYRAVKAWDAMITLVVRMSPPLARTVMIREQLALALNRAGQGEEAEQVLLELIEQSGPSSETLGILGRVYKDRWEIARDKGETFLARALLEKAIATYLRGFECDWRDAYPGINAVTLMELRSPPDPRRLELIPLVRYAVQRRLTDRQPDYWDHATRLELAVLGQDMEEAMATLGHALATIREPWEPETTLRNLRLIRQSRHQRGVKLEWDEEVETALARKCQS